MPNNGHSEDNSWKNKESNNPQSSRQHFNRELEINMQRKNIPPHIHEQKKVDMETMKYVQEIIPRNHTTNDVTHPITQSMQMVNGPFFQLPFNPGMVPFEHPPIFPQQFYPGALPLTLQKIKYDIEEYGKAANNYLNETFTSPQKAHILSSLINYSHNLKQIATGIESLLCIKQNPINPFPFPTSTSKAMKK